MPEWNLVSVNVGLPRQYGRPDAEDPMDQPWVTATYKSPLEGPAELGRLGLAGDGQADRENHGGVDKAVLVYSGDHYPYWQSALGIPEFTAGALGENFTVEGATEKDVCIGDQYAIEDTLVEVSQPRQPCWKQARRWRIKNLVVQILNHGGTGWYLRVIRGGVVSAGMKARLTARPYPQWTIARANQIMHFEKSNGELARQLAAVEPLSEGWKAHLIHRSS